MISSARLLRKKEVAGASEYLRHRPVQPERGKAAGRRNAARPLVAGTRQGRWSLCGDGAFGHCGANFGLAGG
jgi:hypothetical protein